MIIDGHAYCFPPLDSPAGYTSVEEKMTRGQRELGGHHQPVWRVRDRAPADNDVLIDPATGELRSITWKRDLGRLVWEYDGETYTKQYVPPMLHNLESTPEGLIREMDYIRVEKAILHTSSHLGRLNEYLGDATSRYPDRLMRLVNLPDWEIRDDPQSAVAEVESEIARGGCAGIQFFTKYYYDSGPPEPWDDGAMRPYWEAVTALGLPLYFTVQAPSGKRYSSAERDAYMDQLAALIRWMDRYPDVTVVMTHGLPWRTFLEGDRIRFPENIWDPFKNPKCHLQLLFPIQLGGLWEYPWTQAEPTVKECVERVGADRLIWGTDMPMVARFCTYRQTMDQYRLHCDFLSDDERASILGGTVARIHGIEGG